MVLKIYDILGHEIRTLVNEEKPAGYFEVVWDGADNTGKQVTSGIYLYQIEAKNFIQTKKMVKQK